MISNIVRKYIYIYIYIFKKKSVSWVGFERARFGWPTSTSTKWKCATHCAIEADTITCCSSYLAPVSPRIKYSTWHKGGGGLWFPGGSCDFLGNCKPRRVRFPVVCDLLLHWLHATIVCECVYMFACLVFYVLATSEVISGRVPTCDSANLWWLYSAAPLGNWNISTMTWYPTQSHYPDTCLRQSVCASVCEGECVWGCECVWMHEWVWVCECVWVCVSVCECGWACGSGCEWVRMWVSVWVCMCECACVTVSECVSPCVSVWFYSR